MAELSLALLGPLQVTLDGAPITTFESDKVRALLAYLAVEADRPHRRDALAGLLWPERPERAAHLNLNQALANLRGALGDRTATPPFLCITRETVQFNRASDYELDVETFRARFAACEQHPHRHPETCKPCVQRLQQAIDLYRGSFLAQFFLSDSAAFEEWALLKREWLHRRALRALARLADYHERRADYEQAQHDTWRQLELDPWREESHRQLMRVLALSGQRSAALEQYERCRRALADELGVEPAEETTALYERICTAEYGTSAGAEYLAFPAARPHNLPPQPTPFIGRENELVALADLLAQPACRLITLVGPGGIGKTRLALQAATDQIEAFAQGVSFVPLAPLRSSEFLVPAIASALGLAFSGREDPRAQLLTYLRGKEVLLVLDNFEHLLEGTELLVDILRRASVVTLLVTSRERLNLQGEWVFDIPGLQVPAGDQTEGVEDYSAVALFVQRARKVHARFTFGEAEKLAVARICQLVEGMPLGVELAAAWVRALSCADIAQEIEQSLGFLTTSLRDVPERHRSLRAVFDHSWRLLSADERGVFRKLSVFRGGFGRDAAEQVAGATLPLLAAVVDKSLLRRNAAGRYELHELVRQYADEQLREAGETEQTRDRHLAFFLALAEAAEPWLTSGERTRWLVALDAEHDNLRAALAWSQTEAAGSELGLRLAGALYWFWHLRDYASEGRGWLAGALAQIGASVRTPARAKALKGVGALAWSQGDYAAARSLLTESVAMWREVGNKQGLAHALLALGWVQRAQRNLTAAYALEAESMALFRELGDSWGLAFSLDSLGSVTRNQGDYAAARALLEESAALFRELRDPWGLSLPLNHLGIVALAQGDYAAACARYMEGLMLRRDVGHSLHMADSLTNLAEVASVMGQPERAARLWGAAEALYDSIGAIDAYMWPVDYDRAARAQRDDAAFAVARAEGRAMTLEQAISYALGEGD